MSLKVVTRAGTETLYLRGTVRGIRVFESAGTSNRGLAEEARSKRERELFERAIYGARAVVTFAEAAASYLESERRSPTFAGAIVKLIQHFGTAKLSAIDQTAVDKAYKKLLSPDVVGATKLRWVLTPIRAIMEHAARRGWCDRPAFEKPRMRETPGTAFMLPSEATALVQAAAPHLKPLLVFLIGTGCRMSEALELEWPDVDLRGARAVVWQKQGNQRRVDLPPVVLSVLTALPHREGRLFRPPSIKRGGVLIVSTGYRDTGRQNGGQIKTGWKAALRRAGLSSHLSPHDCRHTWASWHYAMHLDLLRLRIAGGWASVAIVERYAHLMPTTYVDEARAWLDGGAELVQLPQVDAKILKTKKKSA